MIKHKDKKINIYYCNCDNFGDKINNVIFKKCFNLNTQYSKIQNSQLLGIGSIIHNCLMRNCDLIPYFFRNLFTKNDLYILGSGFGFDGDFYNKKRKYIKPLRFKKNIKVIGVRGVKTKAILESILKKPLNDIILGDLGLLSDKILDNIPLKKYSLGIVPHYADFDDPIFEKIKKENPNSVIISTKGDSIEVLKKIAECNTILSTGLHPLIAADSLNIPNIYARISETTTSRFKYKDYYSIFNLDIEPFDLRNNMINEKIIKERYKLDPKNVQQIKKDLFEKYTIFFENIINTSVEDK